MSAHHWVIVAVTAAVGCSRTAGPVCYPVRGHVLYDGKPLAEALVVFHPLDPVAGDVPRPLGQTDSAGRFELTTLESRDGAPAGRYAICVEQRQARLVGEETVRDGRNLLPVRFGKSNSTPLKYEVVAGENEVPSLLITRQ